MRGQVHTPARPRNPAPPGSKAVLPIAANCCRPLTRWRWARFEGLERSLEGLREAAAGRTHTPAAYQAPCQQHLAPPALSAAQRVQTRGGASDEGCMETRAFAATRGGKPCWLAYKRKRTNESESTGGRASCESANFFFCRLATLVLSHQLNSFKSTWRISDPPPHMLSRLSDESNTPTFLRLRRNRSLMPHTER